MHASDARILRGAALPTGVAGVVAIAVGTLISGAEGALGAALGTVVAIAFFGVSVVAVGYAAKISPQLIFTAAMASYLVKIAAMFLLILLFQDTTAFDAQVFGYSILALTVVWIAAEIRVTLRMRMTYIDDPAEAAGPGPQDAAASAPIGPSAGRSP
ncbi:hypothetical protein [Thermomonospora catenispora]|uniref:hypothetical protein n=1 Tax=Thermomonospora catenispora TaxID=2493090 RepID=UPI00111F405B|nr:hypothetical protein [Thermomonospora catenispora]TNY36996.1 hypothetical protein EIO00_10590 [Thermomonospora catenispora]